MEAHEGTASAVLSRLALFSAAYARREVEAVMALFAPAHDLVFIGTGGDEKRVGTAEVRAQLERDFAQSETVSFTWEWRSVAAEGTVAWLAADGHVDARVEGHDLRFPLRLTAVLARRDERWLFVQAHLSVPAGDEPAGQSFPIHWP